jgi:predicted oxidoreductase
METRKIGASGPVSSRLVYGCMRIVGDDSAADRKKGKTAIRAALEAGYTHFDHADIYSGGRSEELFSEVLKEEPGLRDKIIITSKCGVRGKDDPIKGAPSRYDFDGKYITGSVEGILSRLKIHTLDILLLHRPDYLFNPEEVAGAFEKLKTAGKVRHFGVSNFAPSRVSLLRKFCAMPLVANQVEINIHNISALLDGTLDQCMELGMSPQAWCPLGGVAYTAWGNTFGKEDEARIKKELGLQGKKYGVEDWVVMLAWILKLPAGVFPILGTTNPARIKEATKALGLKYTREDWYRLLEARNGKRVP